MAGRRRSSSFTIVLFFVVVVGFCECGRTGQEGRGKVWRATRKEQHFAAGESIVEVELLHRVYTGQGSGVVGR